MKENNRFIKEGNKNVNKIYIKFLEIIITDDKYNQKKSEHET